MKKLLPIISILIISVFISCNNGMGAESSADPSDSSGALVITDPSKGVVFVDESGVETVIKSVENGEEIICKDVIDYVVLPGDESVSKSSVKTIGRKRAVVLGYRSDGCPGLWIVYSGGIVKPVVNSEDIETSELLEFAEARQPFFKHFGWTYKAVDMVVNDTEIVIAGYAENEDGIPWWKIDPGTTVGVYWSVKEDDDGYYHISRAKVVGYRDYSWWKNLRKEMRKHGYRYRFRWMRNLRLFFFGWYDRYMTMTESVEIGENPGEYLIKGTDDEGEAAVATVTRNKVLSIEQAPDEPENNPPVASFYNFDYLVTNSGTDEVDGEYSFSANGAYGAPTYSKSDDSYYIFRFYFRGFYWGIDTAVNNTLSSRLYYTDGAYPALRPPETDAVDWSVGTGEEQAPEITAVSPVSGYTGDEGSTLRGNYIFSDPDGDLEAGSTYKWYRCPGPADEGDPILSIDDGYPIPDADGRTYTLVGDDSGEWLRFEVTPVDDEGLEGTPLISAAVKIGDY